MKIAIYQLNSTVGAIDANIKKIISASNNAQKSGCELLITPELSICGYPAYDLLLIPQFIKHCEQALNTLADNIAIPTLVGHPQRLGDKLLNAVSLIYPKNSQDKKTNFYKNICDKNYFCASKYFVSGENKQVVELNGIRINWNLGEDIFNLSSDILTSADLFVNLSNNAFYIGKNKINTPYNKINKPTIFVNGVGGQDQWVFDGGSYAINIEGNVNTNLPNFQMSYFKEELAICEFVNNKFINTQQIKNPQEDEQIYLALKTALANYLKKNNFKKIFIGLSGGIDSAVVGAVAVAAMAEIGENPKSAVEFIMLPSTFTSKISINGAKTIAENLGCRLHNFPITNIYESISTQLQPFFAGMPRDLTEENLQARTRAIALMAFANKFNGLIVNTSNRSEGAMGYGTLYGDLIGGYALIKDLYKHQVYAVANYINKKFSKSIIPKEVIERPPSAELRENQKDEDSIPNYIILDEILEKLLDEKISASELIAQGYNKEVIQKVLSLYYGNEYKRRQFPLGLNIASLNSQSISIPSSHQFKEIINE